jgi:chromosome segregation ATPase
MYSLNFYQHVNITIDPLIHTFLYSQDLRQVPSKLQNILSKINITSLHNDLTKLTRFSNECVDSFMQTFQMDGNALLKLYDKLRRTKCPSRVEIEYLYQSLQDFKSSIQVANDKVLILRSKIHELVMSSNEEKKRNEGEVSFKLLKIKNFTTQITNLDSTIKECDEKANEMEIGASELDERAGYLRQQSARHRENGFLWTVFSTTVGLIFTPFTGITS